MSKVKTELIRVGVIQSYSTTEVALECDARSGAVPVVILAIAGAGHAEGWIREWR